MKIVVCGSTTKFQDQMTEIAKSLRLNGNHVVFPEHKANTINEKKERMYRHLFAIENCDLVLVYNGEEDYIGTNTAIEVGIALGLGKQTYLTHPCKIDEMVALGIAPWRMLYALE